MHLCDDENQHIIRLRTLFIFDYRHFYLLLSILKSISHIFHQACVEREIERERDRKEERGLNMRRIKDEKTD